MTSRVIPGPHLPTEATAAEINAVKAIFAGQASEPQQRLGLAWIIKASALEDLSYRPGDMQATAFAEGKRRVGLDIKRAIEMTAEKVEALLLKERAEGKQESERG